MLHRDCTNIRNVPVQTQALGSGGLGCSSSLIDVAKVLEGDSDPSSWIYNLREREGQLSEMTRTAKKLENFKVL